MAGYYDETTGEYIDTGDTGVTEELDDTSGTDPMTDWTYTDGVWTDPYGTKYDLSSDDLPTDFFKKFGDVLSGKSGVAAQLLGLGGISSLLNRMLGGGSSGFAGYKGGIPKYVATREQLPTPQTMTTPQGQTVPRRPGAGGIQYFSPMTYTRAAASGGLMGYGTGGIASLGGYSDGGRLLKGPGDGTSDSIPATIGANKKPARLADGEFVVDARTVSELGNGSTDAGAKKLYAMMNRVHGARKNASRGQNTKADKYLPA